MVNFKCVHEKENKEYEHTEFSSDKGLKLDIWDEEGPILKVECSCQPSTTIIRVTVHGRISVDEKKKGVAIIRRV